MIHILSRLDMVITWILVLLYYQKDKYKIKYLITKFKI